MILGPVWSSVAGVRGTETKPGLIGRGTTWVPEERGAARGVSGSEKSSWTSRLGMPPNGTGSGMGLGAFVRSSELSLVGDNGLGLGVSEREISFTAKGRAGSFGLSHLVEDWVSSGSGGLGCDC